MAFDALHIIWTTYNSQQSTYENENRPALRELYEQLTKAGCYYESVPLVESVQDAALFSDAITLSHSERHEIGKHLVEMTACDGDRIAGGLQIVCYSITQRDVHLLIVPALTSHNQIIGRLKSKTASHLLRSPEREKQKHIWSRGYWFASINGEEAIEKIKHFIHQQCRS